MSAQTANQNVLDFVELTGAIMEKTSSMIATKEAQDQKVAKLIPNAVQALLDNQRIEPHEKEAAAQVLKDPVKVLEILIKTAQHRNDAERAALGKPTPSKEKQASAGYSSLNDGYAGRRIRPGKSESDLAFERGLGLI